MSVPAIVPDLYFHPVIPKWFGLVHRKVACASPRSACRSVGGPGNVSRISV